MLEKREKSIEILYEIVRKIAASSSLKEVLFSVKDGLDTALGGHCEIIITEMNKGLIFDESLQIFKNEKEKAAANWVFLNNKEAGWSTSTLPFAKNLYIPLKGLKEIVGVLTYQPKAEKELSLEEKNFLYTVAHQLANYLERSFSEERERKYEQHKQEEKTYQSILNLISNLFEGPLMNIQEAIKELNAFELLKENNEVDHPIQRLNTSSDSLARILENISAMVNLSAGLTPVDRTFHELNQFICLCFEKIKKSFANYTWHLSLDNLALIPFDRNLLELLFYNLAFHVVEFSLPESTIEIKAKQTGDHIEISISGEGTSIPLEMVDVAFEKFYRLPGSTDTGLGLGMAIAKSIAEIHHGELKVTNRPEGGMIFSVFLPIK